MNAFDWLFRNRSTGEIVTGQAPNPPILVFTASSIVGWLFPDDEAGVAAKKVATGALTWWALDELVRGANPYRRLTGAGTLILLLVRALR